MVSFNICCNFSCFALDALLQLLLLVVAAMFPTCKQLNWCVCVSRERERGRGKRVVGVHDFQLCLINCTQCKAFECCPVTVQCVFVVYPALSLSLSLSLSLAASTTTLCVCFKGIKHFPEIFHSRNGIRFDALLLSAVKWDWTTFPTLSIIWKLS